MTTQQTQTQELRTAAFEAIAEITRLTSEAMIEDSGQHLAPVAAHCRTLRQSLLKLQTMTEDEAVVSKNETISFALQEESIRPVLGNITERMYSADCSPLVQFDDSQRRVKPVRMSWKSQESISEFSARDKTQLPEGYYGKDPECPFRPTAAMIRTKVCLVLWDMRFNKDSILVYYPGLSDTSNDYYWFILSDLPEDVVFKVSQAIADRATELKAQKQV